MNQKGQKRKHLYANEAGKRPRVRSTQVITIKDSDSDGDLDASGPSQPSVIDIDKVPGPRPICKSYRSHATVDESDSDDVGMKRCGPPITISDDEVEISEATKQRFSVTPGQPNKDQPKLLKGDARSPEECLSEYRDFFVGARSCSKCSGPVTPARGHVVFMGDSKLPNGLLRLLHASCTACRSNHCRGCMKPIICTPACAGHPKKGRCEVVNCCASIRTIAIFEVLGGLDQLILGERSTSETRVAQLAEKGKRAANSVGPGGTGYGCEGEDNYRRSSAATSQRSTQAEGLAQHWDELIVRALGALIELLPSPFSEMAQEYDFVPHPAIGYLFSLSRLPELVASLLRNDSVIEWTARSSVYQAMLALLRKLADCELTAPVLLQTRWAISKTCGLEPWMWREGQVVWQLSNGDVEKDPPLQEYFRRLVKQGETFLASASQLMDSEDGQAQETTVQAISLCGDIIAAAGDIDRVMSVLGIVGQVQSKSSNADSSPTLESVYAEACEKIAFKYVVLASPSPRGGELTYPNFNYASELQQSQNSTRMPKNQFRLASELAVMATSLPAGVWVRVDEVRNDAMKFVIAGPDGTPYEGGLFEFDCLMPLDYPNTPPRVHLRTTGGGTVRFNPNLYDCGNVCLSLLGTWPGRPEEQWSSTKSTLLQVIVSVQSMIFIEAPYFNEPGHGQVNMTFQASINYNIGVSYNTVKWGILDWLEEDKLSGIWKDVIVSHFLIKGEKIRDRILNWSSSDSRLKDLTMGSRKTQAIDEFDRWIALLDSKLV